MVLFFSGTGNSKYAASFIADALGDELVSLNDVIKNGLERKFSSQKPFVIAAPIYSWRLPEIVEELVRGAEFIGSKRLYFVATMGSNSGIADKYCEKLTLKKGMEFMGFCGVPMPDNYVVMDVMMDKAAAARKIEAAKPEFERIAKAIANGERLQKTDATGSAWLCSCVVSRLFNMFARGCGSFNVSEKCVSCGRCVRNCPVNNITMTEKGLVFGNKCVACYSCIHRCPNQAINIGNKTQTHGRYVCPEYQKEIK